MKYLLIIIPLFIIFLLFLPVKFRVKFVYNNGNIKLNIYTSYLFGLFNPELDPFNNKKKIKKNTSNNFNRIKGILKNLQYRELISFIWDKSIFKKIVWKTQIGFEDAFLVGIIYGIVWSFKSILFNFIFMNKEVDYIDIDVVPIFNKNQLDIIFDCIIKIRMVYIITIWICFLKLYKGGETDGRASNRRLNENYNE